VPYSISDHWRYLSLKIMFSTFRPNNNSNQSG
jgi:hypothetical protein